MKATELMIGDIISVGAIPRIVVQITKHKIGYHRTELPFGECKMTYARLADITPIPLTPEILEKNGWNTPLNYGGVSSQYICDNSDICVTLDAIHHCLDIRIDDINYDMPRPRYVHELQHALRLCGLNDLADNFKVE